MDFIALAYGGENRKQNFSDSIVSSEESNLHATPQLNIGDRLGLIKANMDLIQNCLESKEKSLLTKMELEKHGTIALFTSAIECVDEKEYRSFAKVRIENMMNRALAEARLIRELGGKICDNKKVGMEFASIEKAYC